MNFFGFPLLMKVTFYILQRYEVRKCRWENAVNRFALLRIAPNLQPVKTTIDQSLPISIRAYIYVPTHGYT